MALFGLVVLDYMAMGVFSWVVVDYVAVAMLGWLLVDNVAVIRWLMMAYYMAMLRLMLVNHVPVHG